MAESADGALTDLDVGRSIHWFAKQLYPICRSITGDGVREASRRIGERIPIDVHEVQTGTPVLGWTVPTDREILLSTHVCHPSLGNDNLSGIGIAVHLAQMLAEVPLRHSVRFLFILGTIGSITWLARNRDAVERVAHGLTMVCLVDGAPITYKKTLGGDRELDRVAPFVLEQGDLEGDRYLRINCASNTSLACSKRAGSIPICAGSRRACLRHSREQVPWGLRRHVASRSRHFRR